MQFALILEPDLTLDSARRRKLINELRRTHGVLGLDEEMAESGLLLADISTVADAGEVAHLEGIVTVEGMGTKEAWAKQA